MTRRKKLAGGARGDAEAYDSDKDEEGKKRRQTRRKQRADKVKKGGRDVNSAESMYSYRSVVSVSRVSCPLVTKVFDCWYKGPNQLPPPPDSESAHYTCDEPSIVSCNV